ncbi:hypothetical protein KKH13_04810 [Patescibacteria group bacterium]|uniref:Uncharacterized protein n=1 Tax=viral metagenome TaxID=1070528 RepID=A0A6M3KY50_9ZZZZ|nr:hypothetical protein [Patescibacteria group bacterium]
MNVLSELLAPVKEERREMSIIMIPGQKPIVEFKGIWSGKYITAAMNSVAKAYRIQARNMVRPRITAVGVTNTQPVAEDGGKGDARAD